MSLGELHPRFTLAHPLPSGLCVAKSADATATGSAVKPIVHGVVQIDALFLVVIELLVAAYDKDLTLEVLDPVLAKSINTLVRTRGVNGGVVMAGHALVQPLRRLSNVPLSARTDQHVNYAHCVVYRTFQFYLACKVCERGVLIAAEHH